MTYLRPLRAFLAIATGFLIASTPARALEIAPYFHAWSTGQTLTQAGTAAGVKSFHIAFAVTAGSCAWDYNIGTKLADMREFKANGGSAIISLGGANGVYAEIACTTDDALFALIEKLMVDANTRRLDWDVEGTQLGNTTGTARRARVLARLQAKYPDLFVSLTLPAWFYGLNADTSMNLLKTTLAAGVRIDRVNVMAMSFGSGNIVKFGISPATMGQAVIDTITATTNQLITLYPSKTSAQVRAMIGITPMIGVNDDGTTFTFDDAQRVADFSRQQGYGLLTYWSFQRDVAQSSAGGALSRYSSVVQSNYQYLNIFKTAGTSTVPGIAPATTTPTTTTTDSPCAYPAWVRGKAYLAGDIVSYTNGKLYKAKYANPGYEPTVSTYYWAEHACVAPAPEPTITTAPAPTPAPEPAPAPVCATSYPAWVQGRAYLAGDIVKYTNGLPYIAKLANPGYDPTVSTDYWASYNCTAAPAPAPAPTPVCTSTDWKRGTTYAAGAMVRYSSTLYKAKVTNRNQTPAATSGYWAASAC